ncbi:hypothetical protein AA103196_2333 [Ameyamaea chiangmaiensis NBRC 103196]|uniref:DUF4159 domain-containing protein n=1 Tax=Ameyamaea chiangmaiensis TaxID=442969 RepID=A0A850P6S6_9PROT|nr:DUF4159 domain-containing protein [Ameyamaea chiangmaiensis]MBS4075408.1 DUF4159 domain-containing protein [Ameyamaea chiangmaiensis]NVN40317.1 DUF4159 domain-containing protein [Ameyamaea chiangmaiensis]GBQ69858.1 hypothetical protein AA103196_2333 [Ameyamaea chiangmaiensis NBRC 103196]
MIFLAPWILVGFVALPVLWWLVRARPPAPRLQTFPPVAWLRALRPLRDDAARAPWWLLLLRSAGVALLVLGLAQPTIVHTAALSDVSGRTLIVVDNGWAAAQGWNRRIAALDTVLDHIARANGRADLVLTAPDGTGDLPPIVADRPATSLRPIIDALRPQAWGTDRARAADAVARAPHPNQIVYLPDHLATPKDAVFRRALEDKAPVRALDLGDTAPVALSSALDADGHVRLHVATLPSSAPRQLRIKARNLSGGAIADVPVSIAAGASSGDAMLSLPAEIRNVIDRFTIDDASGASALHLTDEGDRRRPVGLLLAGSGAETPLVGAAFYLKRALATTVDLREGEVAHLLQSPLSVMIAVDGTLSDPAQRTLIMQWVKKGGTLIRFSGPYLARSDQTDSAGTGPDNLLPVTLVGGARQLGGSMSWGTPQGLAPFDDTSPFHALPASRDVTVSRQVLAQPTADLPAHTWARLTDGTPLVTHASLGDGQIVLFHVTATPDWSTLPLSGLFVDMLHSLIERASGVDLPADTAQLTPALALDGDGNLVPPPPAAQSLAARAFGHTPLSPHHPPGLYGPLQARRALNVGDTVLSLVPAAPFGTVVDMDTVHRDHALGPLLLAVAVCLLLIDMIVSFGLRGAFFRRFVGLALLCVLEATTPAARAQTPPPGAALDTRLGYIRTGHDDLDTVSRQGLQGLSDYVNARTSADLGHPDGVTPEHDDLAYYPMLYWPITSDATTSPARIAALNTYMAHGGILLIDTQGNDPATANDQHGPFAPDAPGTAAALKRVTTGLSIPPLARLTDHHVLAHTFYLLHDFPGRYAGQPIWVAREGDAANDGVSPVIIGSADWAHAWAVDNDGNAPYAVLPDGDDQRRLAYRFGVNAVIYALTGNYKADQVHVPALLHRLGQ